ncbi:membrane-bound PQQ-dependent dehydrogenase, glucose/quinate/shikimate family [Luteimonas sp. Y-2-2-4F]|nr:membrane-bound PQQ-dependent dehydrogenase, glucose/quinate/shikimate family [Luteimonas sp. Y-2-2-4F]MCD9031413.1 membrane-bound PQQ-dependent dehydrogenase, glucose/quinate/shikimate family [Luteimonas sp. Y-2-2-4F]
MSRVAPARARSARSGPLAVVVGLVVALLGLALAAGGAWLVALGGSWYYLPAGLALLVAGVLLARGRSAGAGWYLATLAATALWTAYEVRLSYWGWIPRMGLLVALAIPVALLAPRLSPGWRTGAARAVALACVAVFVLAFGLAFAPHGVTRADRAPSPVSPAAAALPAEGDAQAADAPADADWAAYGRDNAATRYSPLARIDRGNVARLQRVWEYRTGDLPPNRWGAETTPLKIGDTLYLCSARNILIALDARSGQERWRYDPKVSDASIPYTAACRGVAHYRVPPAPPAPAEPAPVAALASEAETDAGANLDPAEPPAAAPAAAQAPGGLCDLRIVEGTLDGRIVAVDAATGTPCPGFGKNGQVDITEGMGDTPPGYVSITSPPTIVRGVIVTGHQVLDGQRRDAPSGVIKGYDAVTGALRWAWDMTRPDLTGLPPEGETYTRGTPNMWTIASGDERLGLVYLPMGNSAADYWSSARTPPEDAYATSLVALDVTTGKPAWHFQTVHIDVWDYDLGSQATLVDFPGPGGTVPALLLPSKQGDLYVLDRRTGRPLAGVEERPVPGGGVEPGRRSPTQPFSLYHTLRKPDLAERDMWGISPLDQLYCRLGFRRASYQGIYTPPTADRHFIQYPGYNGGSDWGGIAVDPRRGVIVANYNDMPNHNRLVPREEADRLGWAPREEARGDFGGAEGAGDPQIGTPYAIDVNAGWRLPFTGLLCKRPPYGGIRAIELATGRTLWDRPFGSARKNGPFYIPSHLPIEIGTPNNGGAAVTAGGLIFIAAATDDLIRAIDIETGETLWSDVLPAGGQAGPAVYEVDGRQYLVIMTGGHHFMETPAGDQVIAYALPEE